MRLLLGICLTSLCCLAIAAEPAKLGAARRLVDLLQIDEMYRESDAACRVNWSVTDNARDAYKAKPDQFGGISPESRYWTDIEALFETYRADVCGGTDIAAMKEIYVQVFSNRLSLRELEDAVAATDSPTGRAMQGAGREAARLLMAYQVESQQRGARKAGVRFTRDLEKLKARYRAEAR